MYRLSPSFYFYQSFHRRVQRGLFFCKTKSYHLVILPRLIKDRNGDRRHAIFLGDPDRKRRIRLVADPVILVALKITSVRRQRRKTRPRHQPRKIIAFLLHKGAK